MGMRIPDFEDVRRLMAEAPDAIEWGDAPATDEQVTGAEAALGIELPAGYRSFLTGLGWARVGTLAVFGLGAGVPRDVDLLAANREGNPGSNQAAIRVARRADGTLFCIDAAHEGPYESPVYECAGDELTYVAHDFSSWLMLQVAEATR